jgi:hypothetical protein
MLLLNDACASAPALNVACLAVAIAFTARYGRCGASRWIGSGCPVHASFRDVLCGEDQHHRDADLDVDVEMAVVAADPVAILDVQQIVIARETSGRYEVDVRGDFSKRMRQCLDATFSGGG